MSGFPDTNNGCNTSNNRDDDDDDDDDETSPPLAVEDLKLMDVTGMEVNDTDDCPIASLTNDQELHVVLRISDNEYESVYILPYADATD